MLTDTILQAYTEVTMITGHLAALPYVLYGIAGGALIAAPGIYAIRKLEEKIDAAFERKALRKYPHPVIIEN